MKPEQIREIVKITIDELIKNRFINTENYQYILKIVDKRLYKHFQKKDEKIESVLKALADDPYIDVIYFQYKQRKTIEWIAEIMDKDVSTIKRNKKRLITEIYKNMEI